jgi:hypothetical protein
MKPMIKMMNPPDLRCSGLILACCFFFATAPLPAGVLYEQNFDNIFDDVMLDSVMRTPDKLGNRWHLSTEGGIMQSSGLAAPSGEPLTATAQESFEGFATNPVITVSVDTRVSMRMEGSRPWSLPFVVNLLTDPEDATSVLTGFSVNYVQDTAGESTEYEIRVPGSGQQTWRPAAAMEGFEENQRDSSVRGWFRWTATFTLDPETSMLKTKVSVASLGQDGFYPPEVLETWEFAPEYLESDWQKRPLLIGLTGRAREGFGVTTVDNILVTSGPPES